MTPRWGPLILSAVMLTVAPVLALAQEPATKGIPVPPDASGPQTAIPAPRAEGGADVPGGSAKNGVIRPPSTGPDSIIRPPVPTGRMPVIRPPGTPENQPDVQPK